MIRYGVSMGTRVWNLAHTGRRRVDSWGDTTAVAGASTGRYLRARQVSVFTGALLIAIVLSLTLKRVGPRAVRGWWALGLFWLALTLTFEIGLGRATGTEWDRLASDFDPRRGGLLGFGMLGHPRGAANSGGTPRSRSRWRRRHGTTLSTEPASTFCRSAFDAAPVGALP